MMEVVNFVTRSLMKFLASYGVKHKVSILYHPQMSGQVEVSNVEIKRVLGNLVSMSRKY